MQSENLKWHRGKRCLVGRRKNNGRCGAVVVGEKPVGGRDAPSITRTQPWEPELRQRSTQVVADAGLMFKELLRDDGAHRVASTILLPRVTGPVAVETRDWIDSARLETVSKDVERHDHILT